MKDTPLIHDNFLLQNKFAEQLYHEYASKEPIIDYHGHLPPQSIANNEQFKNLTHIWLYGDHYKWRAMRTFGVDEKYITGNASDIDKFREWARTVPHTLRNPLYHWTHLELAKYFGVYEQLNPENADEIYNIATQQLQQPSYSCRNLLTKMNVKIVCTTDDPADSLEPHKQLLKSSNILKMLPSFRPDRYILIEADDYVKSVEKLAEVADEEINSFNELCDVLEKRADYFNSLGGKLSDHGLNQIRFKMATDREIEVIFQKRMAGKMVSPQEAAQFETALLLFLSKVYHKLGWVQQFHLGALRNNNKRMFQTLGPDTGWDSIGDFDQAESLSKFFNTLDESDQLCKTIIYNLNPAQNEVFAGMIGNYNDGSTKGKMQYGTAWWFLDQKDGITKQLNALSNLSLLSVFVGMVTDSRSFLSFPRHEYFRRVLCNILGTEIENGELPNDIPFIGQMVANISYRNAKNYFNF